MKTSDFFFELPEELIAQVPSGRREESRLMQLKRQEQSICHRKSRELPDLLPENAMLVINNAKVRRARIYGKSESGGMVEFLLLNPENRERSEWKAMVSKAKRQRPGKRFHFPGAVAAQILEDRELDGTPYRRVSFSASIGEDYLAEHGHMPLPPYIQREDNELDESRYQTVYAEKTGSVAAPTAGLHLTEDIIGKIQKRGISIERVTLHVGLGTFLPVRSEALQDHEMHREAYEIDPDTAARISEAKASGRPIVAVGTTSVRTLESAWDRDRGCLVPGRAETDLFIYPGYDFSVVDQIFTNFHTPKSTLLMLVSAFAGKDFIDRAYAEAVKERYRFFSYGDAMLIQ